MPLVNDGAAPMCFGNLPRHETQQLWVVLLDSLVKHILFAIELLANSPARKAVHGGMPAYLMTEWLKFNGIDGFWWLNMQVLTPSLRHC